MRAPDPARPWRRAPARAVAIAHEPAAPPIVILGEHPDDPPTLADGTPWPTPDPGAPPRAALALAPPALAALRWIAVPPMPPAQAAAAARALAAEGALGDVAALHIVAGTPDGAGDGNDGGDGGAAPVATVAVDVMTRWLAAARRAGIEPLAIVPAGLAVAPPAEGDWVRVAVGTGSMLRGHAAALPDEPALMAALAPLAAGAPVGSDAFAKAAIDPARVAAVPLDLLTGAFAPRLAAAPVRWRLMARVLLGAGLLVVAGQAAIIHRLHRAAAAEEAAAAALVATILDPAPSATTPPALVEARLAALRASLGGDGTALGLAASLYAALGRHGSVTLETLAWDEGRVTATVSAPSLEAVNALLLELQTGGYRGRVAATPVPRSDGRSAASLTLGGRP